MNIEEIIAQTKVILSLQDTIDNYTKELSAAKARLQELVAGTVETNTEPPSVVETILKQPVRCQNGLMGDEPEPTPPESTDFRGQKTIDGSTRPSRCRRGTKQKEFRYQSIRYRDIARELSIGSIERVRTIGRTGKPSRGALRYVWLTGEEHQIVRDLSRSQRK